jgi:hypothetical protein
MVLVGHSQRLAEPLSGRQRRVVAACGIALLLAAIIAGVLAATNTGGSPVSRDGCVNMVVASSTGAQPLHQCGLQARAWCKTEYGRHDQFALEVQTQCRLAGIRPSREKVAS